MRFVIVFVVAVIAACSGKSKPAPQTAAEGSGSAIYAKKILLTWGIEQHDDAADIFLQTTDETGKQVSHPLGSFPGQCAHTTAAEEMSAIIAVACKTGGTGTELHAVVRDAEIIVVKMRVDEGVTPDPMSREEVTRVKAPVGASITAG